MDAIIHMIVETAILLKNDKVLNKFLRLYE